MAPEVTVLIPSYNRAHLIGRAVNCALTQTYPNCHVIVVDDGSTDGTSRLIAEQYGTNPRVRYVYQRNRGVAAARNLGLELARGEYVAFLDSDDLWKPWKIELQVACLQCLPGVGMIWTDMDAVDAQGRLVAANCMRESCAVYQYFGQNEIFEQSKLLAELAPMVKDPGRDTRVYWGDVFSPMVMGNLCQPSTVLITRERALRTGGFNESMLSGEDHDYHLRLSRKGPFSAPGARLMVVRPRRAGSLARVSGLAGRSTPARRCAALYQRGKRH